MRCRIGDQVLVLKGEAAGAIGAIIDVGEPGPPSWEWLVEFPRPVPSFSAFGRRMAGVRVNSPDRILLPLRPDADPVTVETEREVVA